MWTNESLIEFTKTHKMDLQNANSSVLPVDFVFCAYIESDSVTGVIYEPVFAFHINETNFYQIIEDDLVRRVAKSVYQKSMNNISYFKKIYDFTLKNEKQTDALWKKAGNIEKLSDEKLVELFSKVVSTSQDWWKRTVIGEDKGRVIEEEIVPVFEKNHSLLRSEAIMTVSLLSHPKDEAIFTAERKLVYKIALELNKSKFDPNKIELFLKKNKKVALLVKEYQKKFFFSKSSFLDRTIITPSVLLLEAFSELNSKGAEQIRADIERIELERKGIENKKKEILKKIKLSKEEKNMIVFASMLSVWLDYRKRGMMKQFYYIFSILHEFSKRKNIPYLTLNNMTVDEFLNFIKTGKGIDPKEIERRKEALITVHTKGNKTKIIYGEDAVKIFESSKHKISEGQEIKGSIASMGKEKTVRGVARIVIDPSKDEFNDGEILVASMTRIEFVPLMKKASAIVTDEGGIACHAAIVSRELGVPCIIGTKIATRMLHNGDKIELDLTKGTVKVLSD